MGKRARGRSMIGSVSPTSSRWRYVVVPSLSAPPLCPSMSPIACYHCPFPGWRAPPAVTSTLCSSCYASQDPGVRGADDPKTKFNQKRYIHKGDVQQRTSFPCEALLLKCFGKSLWHSLPTPVAHSCRTVVCAESGACPCVTSCATTDLMIVVTCVRATMAIFCRNSDIAYSCTALVHTP